MSVEKTTNDDAGRAVDITRAKAARAAALLDENTKLRARIAELEAVAGAVQDRNHDGGNIGLRTERVTLEIAQLDNDDYLPIAEWGWNALLRVGNECESVSVVEAAAPAGHRGSGVFDANGDEVPWEGVVAALKDERDAAIRERDAANERRILVADELRRVRARAAEDGRIGPLPTLECAIAAPFAKTARIRESETAVEPVIPAADAQGGGVAGLRFERSLSLDSLSLGKDGNVTARFVAAAEIEAAVPIAAGCAAPETPANGMRTERVTLELTGRFDSPPSEWPWEAIFSQDCRVHIEPGDNVRVVDEVAIDAAWAERLTDERDAAIREREEAKRRADFESVKCSVLEDDVIWLRTRVAELESAPVAESATTPPSARGWLTEEERGALERAFDLLCDDDGDNPLAGTVQRLLARTMPPEATAEPFTEDTKSSPEVSKQGDEQSGLRTERVVLEVTHCHEISAECWGWRHMLDLEPDESVRVVEETHFDDLAQVAMERDAAIRERQKAEQRADRDFVKCGALADKVIELRARVAELEAAPAASGAANSPESPVGSEPVALSISPAERDGLQAIDDGLRRHGNGFVVLPGSDSYRAVRSILDRHTTAPPPARGWLTEEERRLIESLEGTFQQKADALRSQGLHGHVDNWERKVKLFRSLLARSTPPEVVLPNEKHYHHITCASRDADWIAALAAAGVKVKEVGK